MLAFESCEQWIESPLSMVYRSSEYRNILSEFVLQDARRLRLGYIVGCRGASQLGGPFQGYKANKLKIH